MNNSTIPIADCTTHVKIIAVALAASVAVLLIGLMARPAATENAGVEAAKSAGRPVAIGLAI